VSDRSSTVVEGLREKAREINPSIKATRKKKKKKACREKKLETAYLSEEASSKRKHPTPTDTSVYPLEFYNERTTFYY